MGVIEAPPQAAQRAEDVQAIDVGKARSERWPRGQRDDTLDVRLDRRGHLKARTLIVGVAPRLGVVAVGPGIIWLVIERVGRNVVSGQDPSATSVVTGAPVPSNSPSRTSRPTLSSSAVPGSTPSAPPGTTAPRPTSHVSAHTRHTGRQAATNHGPGHAPEGDPDMVGRCWTPHLVVHRHPAQASDQGELQLPGNSRLGRQGRYGTTRCGGARVAEVGGTIDCFYYLGRGRRLPDRGLAQ